MLKHAAKLPLTAEGKKKLVEVADRRGFSDRSITEVTNVFLQYSVPHEPGITVSNTTLRDLRLEVRERAVDDVLAKNSHLKLVGIMLDERKDRDPVNSSRRIEHCSVVVVYEDGTEVHVGHFCPEPDDSGKYTGKNLAESLHNFCLKRKVPTSDIKFIGTDGTLKMTGHKTGAQAEFEKILCRPLQRMGCMFHNLELVSQIIYNQVRDWMLNISNECSTLYLRSSPSPDVPISILGVV